MNRSFVNEIYTLSYTLNRSIIHHSLRALYNIVSIEIGIINAIIFGVLSSKCGHRILLILGITFTFVKICAPRMNSNDTNTFRNYMHWNEYIGIGWEYVVVYVIGAIIMLLPLPLPLPLLIICVFCVMFLCNLSCCSTKRKMRPA